MRYVIFLMMGCFMAQAQTGFQYLNGVVKDDLNTPVEGVTIFNQNTLDGTVTNTLGRFSIKVKVGDKLSIKALAYSDFTLVITKFALQQEQVSITMKEGVNLLDEIEITTGNVPVTVQRPYKDPQVASVSQVAMDIPGIDRTENTLSDMTRQPEDIEIRREAFMQSQLRYNMFDVVGLLVGALTSALHISPTFNLKGNKKAGEAQFNKALIDNIIGKEALMEFLELEEDELYPFFYYAQDNGLTAERMNEMTELDLLEFLRKSRMDYKKK